MTNVKHESWKAAQDAPPAPREQQTFGSTEFERLLLQTVQEHFGTQGRDYLLRRVASQPSPAHEALIARLSEYAEHTQQCEKWERDWHGNGIALLDERPCTCGLSDILTALKGAQ